MALTPWTKGLIGYFVLCAILLIAVSMLAGCQPLRNGESRKITAWGFWAVVGANPIGIGYWHSERGPGPDIDSEQSAPPPAPPIVP